MCHACRHVRLPIGPQRDLRDRCRDAARELHGELGQCDVLSGRVQQPVHVRAGAPVVFGGAPFAYNKAFGVQTITDGTSNTLLMGEVIACMPSNGSIGADVNHRGMVYNDDYNCTMFMAYTAPNSNIPDFVPEYCVYPYGTNPPCFEDSTAEHAGTVAFNATRSFHAGGVNAVYADGGVRFAKNSISLSVWQALSTTRGGEVISADSY